MIAAQRAGVLKYAVQDGRFAQANISFLFELACQRVEQALAGFHPTARQVPARHVAVADEEHAAARFEHDRTHAERHPACEPPIEVQESLDHPSSSRLAFDPTGSALSGLEPF